MQYIVCSCISVSTEYKQNHSSGPELRSLKRKERKLLFPQNPNGLHVINKHEQVPHGTWLHKNWLSFRKTTHKALPALYLPVTYGVSISDKTSAKQITQERGGLRRVPTPPLFFPFLLQFPS